MRHTLIKTLLACFITFPVLLVYTSCRKIDQSPKIQEQESQAEKFLNVPGTVPNAVKRVAQTIREQNDRYHFLDKFIKEHGFAVWDKSSLLVKPGSATGRSATYRDSIVIIPIVKPHSAEVQSFLGCIVKEDSVGIRLFDGGSYPGYGFGKPLDSLGADFVAASIMYMGCQVYGDSTFIIEDKRLFDYRELSDASRYFVLTGSGLHRTNSGIVITTTICFNATVQDDPPGGGGSVRLAVLAEPIQICWSYDQVIEFVNPYMPSGTFIPTGGGSTGPGWWSDDPCREIDPTGNNGGCGNNDTLGWVPLDLNEPPSDPVDTLLKKYSLACNKIADSLMNLSLTNNNSEYVAIIVMKNDSIYCKNIKTDNDSMSSTPNNRLAQGEILLGSFHTHPRNAINDRSAPSGGDISFLKSRLNQNYTLFVECGNVRYALVVEDVIKAGTFLKSNSLNKLTDSLYAISLRQSNWFSNWQNATQVAVATTLGSASTNGIGFYISNNTTKTLYTKLNP